MDAHQRVHLAVAVDELGRPLGAWRGPTTPAGWTALVRWAQAVDDPAGHDARRWGIAGAWGDGRGLAQQLVAGGARVVDVNPRLSAGMRRQSREPGKRDRLDAQAVARVVCRDEASLPAVAAEDGTTVLARWSRERRALVATATARRNRAQRLLADLDPADRTPRPDLTTRRGIEALRT